MKIATFAVLALLASPVTPIAAVCAQTASDSAAIRATALDYVEGWYSGDAARMERALHPELAKRVVLTNPRTGRSRLDQMGALTLVQQTREPRIEAAAGSGVAGGRGARRKDVRVLDVFGSTASVRTDMDEWIDYMHMAKWNGRWVIVNVLWELRQTPR
jgi:hypothetical protein